MSVIKLSCFKVLTTAQRGEEQDGNFIRTTHNEQPFNTRDGETIARSTAACHTSKHNRRPPDKITHPVHLNEDTFQIKSKLKHVHYLKLAFGSNNAESVPACVHIITDPTACVEPEGRGRVSTHFSFFLRESLRRRLILIVLYLFLSLVSRRNLHT